MSRPEVETALIAAGMELVKERGVEPGLGEVTLNEAIATSGVPRASAYRAFAHPQLSPQEAFRAELVSEYLASKPLLEAGNEAASLAERLAERCSEAMTSAEVAAQARELLADWRQEGQITASSAWPIVGPMWIMAGLGYPYGKQVGDAVEEVVRETVEPDLRAFCQRLGLRPRAGTDWYLLALMVFVAGAVSSLHESINPRLRNISRPVGPDDQAQAWSQSGLFIEGLLLTTLEPDPDAEHSIELKSWLAPGWANALESDPTRTAGSRSTGPSADLSEEPRSSR